MEFCYILLIIIIYDRPMYLPSFYKTKFEKYAFNTRRVLPFAIPALIWGKLCPYCSHLVVMATDIQHHLYRYHPPSPRRREENPRIMIVNQIKKATLQYLQHKTFLPKLYPLILNYFCLFCQRLRRSIILKILASLQLFVFTVFPIYYLIPIYNNKQKFIQMKSLEQLRAYAQLAEQTQRYDDMVMFTRQLIEKSPQINQNDRKLFANAYKCKVSQRRTAWRAVSTYLFKQNNPINKPIVTQYKDNLQKEIRQTCGEVIEIVSKLLNKKSQKNISQKDKQRQKLEIRNKLQFYKIKGDYLRYLCQIAKDSQMKALKQDCEKAYKQAFKAVQNPLVKDSLKTDALKLGICLNFAVFYYQINNSIREAIQICEKGFNQALESVSDLEDTRFTDVVTIMQLMHDNITAWKLELQKSTK